MTDPADILILLASPRAGGNGDTLVHRFLEPAREQGLTVNEVRLAALDIGACRACGRCETGAPCPLTDDFPPLVPALLGSPRVVFCSPVFFYGVPAQAKAFIDRSQVLWARKYIDQGARRPAPLHQPGRKGFLIGVGASHGQRLFDGLTLTVKYFFDAIDVGFSGSIVFRGLDKPGDAAARPDILESAGKAGEAFFQGP